MLAAGATAACAVVLVVGSPVYPNIGRRIPVLQSGVNLPPPVPRSNSVTVRDTSGAAHVSRPFSISRVFAEGEIRGYPQPRVGGRAPALWQADVKNRWRDGSVRHAIVSFSRSLPANGTAAVDFVSSPNACSAGGPAVCSAAGLATAAALLAPPWMPGAAPWDAEMEFEQGGARRTVNARAMLSSLSFDPDLKLRYWLQGPVVTQAIVEDRSPARSFDTGWNAPAPIHPWFVLTFYDGWQGVKVDFIAENSWTDRIQDVSYSMVLKTSFGGSALAPVYRKPAFTHFARARWRKTFWAGAAPGSVNIDFNFPYMIRTGVLPNYDLTKVVSNEAIGREVADFDATDRGDVMGSAQWTTAMGSGGGRGDIGIYPRWTVLWLYTMDPGLYEVMMGNASAGGSLPMHFREALAGRFYDAARTVDAFGRYLSKDARPTLMTTNSRASAAPADRVTPAGPVNCPVYWYLGCVDEYTAGPNPWTFELAHQPSFAYVPYLVTGDYYWLEEMYFIAAMNAGASGDDGGTFAFLADWSVQHRGAAWGLRNLGDAAFAAVDQSPEQAYFTEKLNYNLAGREGQYAITSGAFYDPSPNSAWTWGRVTIAKNRVNPVHFGDYPASDYMNPGDCDSAQTGWALGPWRQYQFTLVMGHLAELGFQAGALRDWMSQFLIGWILDPGANGYMVTAPEFCGMMPSEHYFQSRAASLKAFPAGYVSRYTGNSTYFWTDGQNYQPNDPEYGYAAVAWAAASYMPLTSLGSWSGQGAWDWLHTHIPGSSSTSQLFGAMNDNPKWAIVPRPEPAAAALVPRFSCPRARPDGAGAGRD